MDLALIAAGGCVVAWFTGYAFGSLKRFFRRIFSRSTN
ncbi:hypothetical protein THL1_2995 [Pseudomonas sp. TCU-HL1]|nr:hypothetical protein THL1_2983 [Pseudomonas sp. TCU-HL1]AOE85543.1 hypothetical protein THL1_2995 [Pseudomonas sp. TCU-HL1]